MNEITTVRLEDIHRRPNARPLDDKLVEQITESIKQIGFSPAKPLELKRDGEIYWTIDGEHRREAAIRAGLTEVPATIEPEIDDVDVLVHEGLLNLQRPDTEEERWNRAQQFFALGDVSASTVAVATGIDADTQAKARKVIRKLDDDVAAEDVSLDQAIAAHEFIDDDKAFTAIMNAGANWQGEYRKLQDARKRSEARAMAEEIIREAGLEVVAEQPEGTAYLRQVEAGRAIPEGATCGSVEIYGTSAWICWYGAVVAKPVDTEAIERRKAEDARIAQLAEAKRARLAFVASHMPTTMHHPLWAVAELAFNGSDDVEAFNVSVSSIDDAMSNVTGLLNRMLAALLCGVDSDVDDLLRSPKVPYYRTNYGPIAIAYMAALQGLEYEPCAAELDVINDVMAELCKSDGAES